MNKIKKHNESVLQNQYVGAGVVAGITGRAVGTLANDRCYRRGIPYIKLGSRVIYDLDDVYEYLEAKKIRFDD